MDRNRDIVTECEVVKEVDGEKESNARKPTNQGYGSRFEEKRGVRQGEVSRPGEQSRD